MTEPLDPDTAHLRLDVAISQLLEPGREQLDRDPHETRTAVRDIGRQHLAHIRYLTKRLADARERGDDTSVDRARCAMRQAGHSYRERRAALHATSAVLPSLLEQLVDGIPGSANTDHNNSSAGAHRSPLALAALDLIHDIQIAVGNRDVTHLTHDIRTWSATTTGTEAAELAEAWVDTGRAVLNPPRRWSLPAACPACGEHTAHVQDGDDTVRRPALELDRSTVSARCLRCGTRWNTEKLRLLATVLEDQLAQR